MWKRLNNPRASRSLAPQEHEGYEENPYRAFGLGIRTRDERQTSSRPRESMDSKGLPRLPNSNLPPPDHRDSRLRPASSIYSQPSPNPVVTKFQNSYPSYPEEEVSPPSSPEFDGRNYDYRSQQHEPDVSPIDEMPDVSQLSLGRPPSRPESSSIPVLRRQKRRNQVAAAAANLVTRKEVGDTPKGRIAHDPRWDPYTGEITTSEKGKPQSAKPGQFATPGLRTVHKETGIVLGNESNVTSGGNARASFGDRVRKLKSTATSPTERLEWRGATGRQTIVSPVEDCFDIPPISIPRKSSRRVASPHSGSQSGNTTPVTIIRSGDGETSPASVQPEHIDPTTSAVLSNSGRNSPRVTESPVIISPDPVLVPQSAAITRLARGNTDPVRPLERDDTLHGIERSFREAFKGVPVPEVDPYEQPPSRFSITTYAPSEAHSTPRPSADSERSAMPTPPTAYEFEQSTVLDRKRPKISGSPQSNISRKAVNPGSPVFLSMSPSIVLKRSSNVAKNLPMSPAEAASHDLVTQLQAQLDNLAHRRNNITMSIRQMTELMPKDHLILTEEVRRKREEEKRKVEMLRVEEADVRREEHEIGLRLHRAYKRRDKEAIYEPTGLWVRRVTG